jgi:hypothetical protein
MFEFPFSEVFAIRQVGSSIWSTRRGKLNLGLDYAHSDESTQFSLDASFAFQGKRFRWTNGAQASISDDADSEAKERDHAWSHLEIPFARQWSWGARFTYDRNTELELESRYTASGGVFWLPWRSDHGRFSTGLGVAESSEKYTSGSSSSVTFGAVLVGLEYYRFGAFGTQFAAEAAYLPALSGPNRYRIELQGTFTQKIASDFNVSVSPYYSYDSRTPIEGIENEDWGWIASVGWIF